MNVFRRTPSEVHDLLYGQLQLLDMFFISNNIPYWIIGGTLLGQVREGQIIKWDDDVDIGVPVKYKEEIFQKLRTFVQEKGMELWNTIHGFKVFSLTHPNVGTDIFFYQQVNDRWVLAQEKDRQAWPRDWFTLEEIENRTQGKFGDVQVWIPGNPQRYLFELYGPDCLIMAQLHWDHLNNCAYHNTKKVPLSKVILG